MNTRNVARPLGVACAIASLSVTGPTARADDPAIAPRLGELGMRFEEARGLVGDPRTSALTSLESAITDLTKSDLTKRQEAAAAFLAGEVCFALGRFDSARHAFDEARSRADDGPLGDDAWIGRIDAIEAMGDDKAAAKEWERWEGAFGQSALRAEVKLARAWNAIRRGAGADASRHLDALATAYPWMMRDERVMLARATVSYMSGDAAGALTLLPDGSSSAEIVFLRGLARAAAGKPLEAAASFQELANRFPDSSLRDHALLAKANVFFAAGGYRSAADELAQLSETTRSPEIRAEALLRRAAATFLDGDAVNGATLLSEVTVSHAGTSVAARAQYLLAEVLWSQERHDEAILAFNEVLTRYFEHELAASAQYRVARSLDALGRKVDATSAYQAVTTGYPLAPEAPAAAYLAGVGLLEMGQPQAAATYFQLVLDRYVATREPKGDGSETATFDFDSPEHQELVEAALCMLELSYHRAGDLGRLAGAPHVMLQRMPESSSKWRGYATLIDADALAAQGRHEEAQAQLASLMTAFPEPRIAVPAGRLLAWSQAQQGQDDLAIQTEQSLLDRYGSDVGGGALVSAHLNRAHILFNQKQYGEAAAAYERFLASFPDDPGRQIALYQAGICYTRLDQRGDAVDRWEMLVAEAPTTDLAARALERAGDVYFQAESFEDAKRCYRTLLDTFGGGTSQGVALLRLAQCDYNAGRDAESLEGFSLVVNTLPGTPFAKEAELGMERALYRLGQREDSVDVLAALVDRYPTSSFAADAQLQVAARLYEAERFAEAADAYRRVVTQFPGHDGADEAHYFMAEALLASQQVDEAARAFEQFVIFFPDSELRPLVEFRVAAARFEAGDYMRAAVAFTSVLEGEADEETKTASLYNLAVCKHLLGMREEAIALFDRLRTEHTGELARAVDVAYQLGDMHDEAGALEEALAEFERALGAGAKGALATEIHYRVGYCRERLGMKDAAAQAYRKAIAAKPASDPFRLSALVRCAALYEEAGEYAKARRAYEDLARNAEDPELVAGASERVEQLSTVTQ